MATAKGVVGYLLFFRGTKGGRFELFSEEIWRSEKEAVKYAEFKNEPKLQFRVGEVRLVGGKRG